MNQLASYVTTRPRDEWRMFAETIDSLVAVDDAFDSNSTAIEFGQRIRQEIRTQGLPYIPGPVCLTMSPAEHDVLERVQKALWPDLYRR